MIYGLRKVRSQWPVVAILVAYGLRALIPMGFMPSATEPFSLQICPDGLPAGWAPPSERGLVASGASAGADAGHAHHAMHHGAASAPMSGADDESGAHPAHQHAGGSYKTQCAFAVAAGFGPAPHSTVSLVPIVGSVSSIAVATTPIFQSTRYRIPQSRAPPAHS